MAILYYQGHGSYRIISKSGVVIYVDPYAGQGYDEMADLILVTHEHHDHNCIDLVKRNESTVILRSKEMLKGVEYQTREIKGIKIEATQAYNGNHNPFECVGYLITVDGITIYASGDTSKTWAMKNDLSKRVIDWALLPVDGIYNMSCAEAKECAEIIRAKHCIPIHTDPKSLYNREIADKFDSIYRVLVEPNQSIELN